jgi:signal transduction histidine kinase
MALALIQNISTLPALPGPTSWWLFGMTCLAGAVGVIGSVRYRGDLRRIKHAARALTRQGPLPTKLNFVTQLGSTAWNAVLALHSRQRTLEGVVPAYQEALELGCSIERAERVGRTATETTQLLLRQCAPEALACAVFLNEAGSLTAVSIEGPSVKRLTSSLIFALEPLFQLQSGWGYHEGSGEWNLRTFGIGSSLIVPLKEQDKISGCVWLGLRTSGSALAPQRKLFVNAIAQQAAAAIRTARQFEAQSEQSRQQRDFLLGISHDLRAPGNSALYALRDLLHGNCGILSAEQTSRLSLAESAIEEQLLMLADFLDFTRHQKGLLKADRQPAVLADTLHPLFDIFRLQCERKGLAFSYSGAGDLAALIDPHHLYRIISNLLSNAVKYTDNGEVFVRIEPRINTVSILVGDTGLGISEEERTRLFSEFTRLSSSAGRQGLGLGLALTKALADTNSGVVGYRPNHPHGSIFTLTLERTTVPTSAVQPAVNTVLVVDDDPAACRSVIRQIRHIAPRLIPASTIEDAKRLACELRPELIVTDLAIGDAQAEELLTSVNQCGLCPRILIVSGTGDSARIERLRREFGASFVEKPATRELLSHAISQISAQEPRWRGNNAGSTTAELPGS